MKIPPSPIKPGELDIVNKFIPRSHFKQPSDKTIISFIQTCKEGGYPIPTVTEVIESFKRKFDKEHPAIRSVKMIFNYTARKISFELTDATGHWEEKTI
jgi:hypothetical protein